MRFPYLGASLESRHFGGDGRARECHSEIRFGAPSRRGRYPWKSSQQSSRSQACWPCGAHGRAIVRKDSRSKTSLGYDIALLPSAHQYHRRSERAGLRLLSRHPEGPPPQGAASSEGQRAPRGVLHGQGLDRLFPLLGHAVGLGSLCRRSTLPVLFPGADQGSRALMPHSVGDATRYDGHLEHIFCMSRSWNSNNRGPRRIGVVPTLGLRTVL